MIKAPKGTRDILPKDSYKWRFVETAARKVCKNFGFGEIRTPTFEFTELFARGVGDTTDVVEKQMYTFDDKKGRSITLKPEVTAAVEMCIRDSGRAARGSCRNGTSSGLRQTPLRQGAGLQAVHPKA